MRKNDNAYLLDLKVDIQAVNNLAFQEIALLVDKPDFLQLLPLIRKDFGIVNLVSLDKFIKKAYEEPFKTKEKKKINLSKYKEMNTIKKFAKDNESMYGSGGIEEEMDLYQLIATEVNLICMQFKRPPYFANVVREAIFCGCVDEMSFHPTSAEILESDNAFPIASYFKLPQVAVFVSPTTTYEELKDTFHNAKTLYKTDPRLMYYQPRVDTTPNIRKYREWYWERIKGKIYQKIADEWFEKHESENTTDLDVLKAVNNYKKLLAS